MALTNGIIRLVLLYLESCKSHAPPSITVQSGLTEGKQIVGRKEVLTSEDVLFFGVFLKVETQ